MYGKLSFYTINTYNLYFKTNLKLFGPENLEGGVGPSQGAHQLGPCAPLSICLLPLVPQNLHPCGYQNSSLQPHRRF